MLRLFGHYIPKSMLLLTLLEACLLFASVYLGVQVRDTLTGSTAVVGDRSLFSIALLFCFVTMTMLTAMGLYQRNLREGVEGMLLRMGVGLFLGLLIMSVVFYLDRDFFPGGGAFGLGVVIAVAGLLVTRVLFFQLVDHDTLKERILVLGTGKRAASIAQLKRSVDQRGFQIVGYVHMRGDHDEVDKSRVLPLTATLLEMCNQHQVDEIVVAVDDRRQGFPVEEILDCKMSGIKVVDKLTFFERQMGKLLLNSLHPSWLIFSEGFRRGTIRHITKRVFDISASLALLLPTAPIMLVTAAAIFIGSGFRGPVLYRQVRVGQNWQLFQVLKFRSMRVDAEKDGTPQWAQKHDTRVTAIGAFIRKLRIDELPQILNVLRGDMSFVGPRPERPMFVEQLSEKIPYYAERHRVKPGITGWAQICYPYGASEQDAIEKLQYDLYYVKNYSLFLDLMILSQTAEVILWGKGAR